MDHAMLCDLHVHSNCSDGSNPPEALIGIAREAGVSAVALCDHNTVAGLARFEEAARGTEVIAVPGVEVTAGVSVGGGPEKEVHILGLFIPEEERATLAEFLSVIDRRKAASNRELIARLREAGYKIDLPAVLAVAGEATPNRVHVAQVLMQGGYVGSVREAFDTLLRDGGAYYRPPERPEAFDVIARLRSVGALPVLAHPLLTLSREEIRAFLPAARERGLVGVETVYPLYSEDDAAFMAEEAARFGLLPSGGSDFHGANKPDIRMGRGTGNIAVPMAFFHALKECAGASLPVTDARDGHRGAPARQPELTGTVHPLGSFERYKYVVVCTFLDGRLLLSRHRARTTWETQGGHIEPHETPLEAARRELYEESGITEAELLPICDYCGYRGARFAHGVFFVARASAHGILPPSEMAETGLFDTLPPAEDLTYPLMTPLLFEEAKKALNTERPIRF